MKKTSKLLLIIIGVLVVILFVLVGAAVVTVIHANSNSASTASITPTVPGSTSPSATTKSAARRVTGIIQSINGQTMVLTAPRGNSTRLITVMLTSTTRYRTSTGKASQNDLQVGQKVLVNGTLDPQTGKLDATRVLIQTVSATPTATP